MIEERRSLVIAEFNIAITLEELRKKVMSLGGKIVTEKGFEFIHSAYLISNRQLDELTSNTSLENLKQYNLGTVRVCHLLSIEFILNDIYYSINLNNNPNYDFYYKALETDKKDYANFTNVSNGYLDKSLFDWFYGYDYDHKKVANNILNFLTSVNAWKFNPHAKIRKYVEYVYKQEEMS